MGLVKDVEKVDRRFKLSDADVREIREAYRTGALSVTELSHKYGVTRQWIWGICKQGVR